MEIGADYRRRLRDKGRCVASCRLVALGTVGVEGAEKTFGERATGKADVMRMLFIVNRLQMRKKKSSQAPDFSLFMRIFHHFSAIFHPHFSAKRLIFSELSKKPGINDISMRSAECEMRNLRTESMKIKGKFERAPNSGSETRVKGPDWRKVLNAPPATWHGGIIADRSLWQIRGPKTLNLIAKTGET